MNLALFDIDGTLIHSTPVDDRCYVQAVADVFRISGFSTDWMDYPYSTDSGIVAHLVQEHLGRRPTQIEVEQFQGHFFGLLKAAVQREPGAIEEVPGAARLVQSLHDSGRWQAAIATGTWRRCALWKLGLAGIDATGLPLATANDAHDRVEIVLTAIRRAICHLGCHGGRGVPPERIVYVGDAPWDLRAARRLGIGFVGVAVDGNLKPLMDAGAEHVLTDFDATNRAVALLEKAACKLAVLSTTAPPPEGSSG